MEAKGISNRIPDFASNGVTAHLRAAVAVIYALEETLILVRKPNAGFTPQQKRLIRAWKGVVFTVPTEEEAISKLMGQMNESNSNQERSRIA